MGMIMQNGVFLHGADICQHDLLMRNDLRERQRFEESYRYQPYNFKPEPIEPIRFEPVVPKPIVPLLDTMPKFEPIEPIRSNFVDEWLWKQEGQERRERLNSLDEFLRKSREEEIKRIFNMR